jgi:hypothetical protein
MMQVSYYTLDGMTEAERTAEWTYRTTLDPCINALRSRYLAVALWRDAKAHGYEDIFLAEWRAKRESWMRDLIIRQRTWGTKISRRPQRGRNHDSWKTREMYVRCAA